MTGAKLSLGSQEEQDNLLIQQALAFDPSEFDRELEPGEKADDAIDFGDLSDGDLAEDEDDSIQDERGRSLRKGDESDGESSQGTINPFKYFVNDFSLSTPPAHDRNKEAQTGDFEAEQPESNANDELDYLFTSSLLSSSLAESKTRTEEGQSCASPMAAEPRGELEPHGVQEHAQGKSKDPSHKADENAEQYIKSEDTPLAEPGTLVEMQLKLLAMSGSVAPDNSLSSLGPTFKRGTIPKFMQLLPPSSTPYIGAKRPKYIKPMKPTRINLELANDQARSFKLPDTQTTKRQGSVDYTVINGSASFNTARVEDGAHEPDLGFESTASELDDEQIGGVSWEALDFATADWDNFDERPPSPERMEVDDYESYPVHSKYKKTNIHTDVLHAPFFDLPSLNDPEQAARQISEAVVLDLNDDQLLFGSHTPEAKGASIRGTVLERNDRGDSAKGLLQRYNISNDDEYRRLKMVQHEHIRRTLQNLAVEHSMPAVRLQYPYYKSTLGKGEARSLHRPKMSFKADELISFAKPRIIEREDQNGHPQDIFKTTKDLSLADNSKLLLLEYSEQYPMVLANFGMGSRLINYYRREHADDISRPKLDIGELVVLLPKDTSPFFPFGEIDPGGIVSALSNNMYKAPVFKHEANIRDFLVIRNTTGVEGSTWCIRKIDHLRVVGQQFPALEIPNPQAHGYSTAWMTKRLQMISYRQIKRNQKTTIPEIMKHFPNTVNVTQRQRISRFLHYSPDHREWHMPLGQAVPDEGVIRSMIKPEDVCLQNSGQASKQYLKDIGLSKKGKENDQEDEDRPGMSIEEQLAPWHISKNFIEATKDKCLLELHGEGDPSGRGEAFSFLKTSRDKFKAVGESVEETLNAKKLKDNGRSFNVEHLRKSYGRSMRQIWEAQEQSLSKTDLEMDEELEVHGNERTSRFQTLLKNATNRQDDETATTFSMFTTASTAGEGLRIIRDVRDEFGNVQQKVELVEDPMVIQLYLKRRLAKEIDVKNVLDLKPTGDVEADKYAQKRLENELARLERNWQSRHQRENQKANRNQNAVRSWTTGVLINPYAPDANSGQLLSGPSSSAAPGVGDTRDRRKCTACGQSGHYRSNKKLCTMYMD